MSEWIASKNSDIQTKLGSIDTAITTNLTGQDSVLNTAIATNLTGPSSVLNTAIVTNLTGPNSTLKVLETDYNYFKELLSNHTHDFFYPGKPSSQVPASNFKNKKPVVGLLTTNQKSGECRKTGVLPLSDDNLVTYFKDKNYTIVDTSTTELQKITTRYVSDNGQMCKIHNSIDETGTKSHLYKTKFHSV